MQEDIILALRNGQPAHGLAMAQAEVKATPQDPQAHRLLALALAMNGESAQAHAALDRAIALAPHDSSLLYQRAALLIAESRSDEARAALDHTIDVNPNELRAYVMQAQLALGQGDLEEADRLSRLASRINPNHPWLMTVQGLVLLHREQLKEAHALLSRAAQLAPDDMQTRYALGLSFLAQGHLAFAEQAFRGVVEKNPGAHGMRHMLADVIRRQGNHRFSEAAEVLEAGLAANNAMPADMMRFAGELRLMSGDHARALPLLRRAAAAMPDDRVTLDALIEALRRNGDADDARHTLEGALAAAPEIEGLWSARLSFEPGDGDPAAIADRWHAAIPDSVHPLHVHMWLASGKGDAEAARALAHRIIEREPGHIQAQTQIIEQLYQTDPPAAVAHIQSLLPNIPDPEVMRMVLSWLARAHDRAGQHAEAATIWARLDAIHDPLGEPLPPPSGDSASHAPAIAAAREAAHPIFVFGAPGSGVERVLDVLNHNMGDRMRTDRTTPMPPRDPLQSPETARRLVAGELDPLTVAAAWRAALPARGADETTIIDWLPWWDNALLRVFREAIPGATVLFVLSDPRDMLIDWLQRGTFVRYAIDSHMAIAGWLAGVLDQVATVIEGDLMPHRELRMDDAANDTAAIAAVVAGAMDAIMLPAPALGPGRYPAGHWRQYSEALAEPFALLTPVARRLGYPET